MLELNDIKVVYGGVVLALDGVSLKVNEGEVAVLLGSNGSGKSTTLKSISGVLATEEGELERGSITLDGKRIDKLNPERIARLGIRHLLQGRSVFPHLTVAQNLMLGAYLRRDRDGIAADLARVYGYFPQLEPLTGRTCGYLSGGEQQMVVIGRALLARPRLMLLDEPSMGLAPALIQSIFANLKRISEDYGTTMLIAEQNARTALDIADRGFVLQSAKIVAEGTAAELKDHDKVRGAYLGMNRHGSFVSRHDRVAPV
jgi:branched-chain amino acid transport system ATP-binding protein